MSCAWLYFLTPVAPMCRPDSNFSYFLFSTAFSFTMLSAFHARIAFESVQIILSFFPPFSKGTIIQYLLPPDFGCISLSQILPTYLCKIFHIATSLHIMRRLLFLLSISFSGKNDPFRNLNESRDEMTTKGG